MTVHVTRLPIQLLPDSRRVITRFFGPGEENRIRDIIKRLLAIPESQGRVAPGQRREQLPAAAPGYRRRLSRAF